MSAIFGSGGQLGVELKEVYKARNYEVLAFERTSVDITDAAQVERTLAAYDPQLVINAAAYNQVDVAEKEPLPAFQVNALAVRNLALAARQIDAAFVHFSTDYVFDGMAGRAYREEDATHPLGAYAVSKLAEEIYANAYSDRALIIRTSGVFGPAGLKARGNFVETMLRLASNGQPIRVVEDHVASPTYAPALAERTAELVTKGAHGVFHLGGGTPISWFDWAAKICCGGADQCAAQANERARVSHGSTPPEVFSPLERQSGEHGCDPDAHARRCDSGLFDGPRADVTHDPNGAHADLGFGTAGPRRPRSRRRRRPRRSISSTPRAR